MRQSDQSVQPAQASQRLSETLLNRWLEKLEEIWGPGGRALLQIVREAKLENDAAALCELVRVDLDRHYQVGEAVEPGQYFATFPILFQHSRAAVDIAFEDFRARSSRDMPCPRSRYAWIPGVENCRWYRDLRDDERRNQLVPGQDEPEIGQTFGEFRIICQIGTGAFSRVFLATQAALGSRYVALKVTRRPLNEPQHLAQLQHTGIVPLYSVHRVGTYSVLCMPYSGAATLDDWLSATRQSLDKDENRPTKGSKRVETMRSHQYRDGQSLIQTVEHCQSRVHQETLVEHEDSGEELSESWRDSAPGVPVEAVKVSSGSMANLPARGLLSKLRELDSSQLSLWLACKLSAALAHAHARGIAHGDIKPANILIRNDGEPAFIDFNLSRTQSSEECLYVGGTLPYMAPEQLQSLIGRRVIISTASDIYALALVLYEVIVGRPAFPVALTLAECDLQVALDARKGNRIDFQGARIAAGYVAILQKCLAYDPSQRYPSAQELHEDLEAQLHNRPLRHTSEPLRSRLSKLTRRYPRAFSSSAVAIAALCVCCLIAWWAVASWHRAERLSATDHMNRHIAELNESIVQAVETRPTDDLPSVIENVLDRNKQPAELRYLSRLNATEIAQIQEAEYNACLATTWLLYEKLPYEASSRQRIESLLQHCQSYTEVASKSDVLPNIVALVARESSTARRSDKRLPPLPGPQHNSLEAILSARMFLWAGNASQALDCLRNIQPTKQQSLLFWLTTGAAQLKLGQPESARLSFSIAIAAYPKCYIAYHWRAQAEMAQSAWPAAKADFDRAIALQARVAALYTGRALVCERLDQLEEAIADNQRALDLGEESTRLLFIQARLHRKAGNAAKSAECMRAARQREPISSADWISRAIATAGQNPEGAIEDLQRALQIDPDSVSAWQNIAFVQSEHLKNDEASLEALNQLLDIQPDHQEARGGRCVALARLGRTDEALTDIQFIQAQFAKPLPATIYQVGCAYAQLSKLKPNLRIDAIKYVMRALQQGYGADILQTDQDLEPLRNDPAFVQVLELSKLLNNKSH